MDGPAVTTATAGPSSEVSTPAAYEDDMRHGHYVLSASTSPKPSVGMPAPYAPGQPSDMNPKDARSLGSRFHDESLDAEVSSLRLRSSRLFKGKGKDTLTPEREKKRPLCLLDLPVDILKEIVREVTHTNDLTSLALCHSALHRLTIPHIYSRFDIVWPDSSTNAEPRSGVDALTYGLATLVMAEEIFGEAPKQRREQTNRFGATGHGTATETSIRRRRGNHYAQFTKKFSLGNGPADWVQEYLITKEGGKMLGTLVALAVARMRSLETFVWDMPTGILRDVWLALSSLGDRDDDRPCKLEKVWVRLHDNTASEHSSSIPTSPPLPPSNHSAMPPPPIQTSGHDVLNPQIRPILSVRVERPSFSILPPLKSLSVLDIDEVAYLDELSVLIGRSLEKLRELRIGIARHALILDWVTVWEGESLQQVDPEYPTAGSATIGQKRLGGVLGTLTGFVCDLRRSKVALPDRTRPRRASSEVQTIDTATEVAPLLESHPSLDDRAAITTEHASLCDFLSEPSGGELDSILAFPPPSTVSGEPKIDSAQSSVADDAITNAISAITSQDASIFTAAELVESKVDPVGLLTNQTTDRDHALQLESLELERVPLSVPVLQKAVDWTRLTSLTLLNCPNHEQLWKTLRRAFVPTPRSPTYPQARRTTVHSPKKGGKASAASDVEFDYSLKLKKVHTNTVSPALISFLKETLAPNSLEVLFLQEARSYSSSVQVDAIFRGPLRRHRGSLKKLLVDSSEKGSNGLPTNSSRWRKWMLTRDVLSFVCSGKMPALRELGMAMDYRDWHFFLQHLPSIPQLRSLYLPFLADHVHGANVDARELALQVVDIVTLRPEVELCYMGIATKCFEILENRKDLDMRSESVLGNLPSGPVDPDMPASDDGDEDDDVEDEDDVEEVDEDEDEEEENETESDDDDDAADDTDSETDGSGFDGKHAARLRLREILFYDDKVAIFKARHGRL